MQNSNPPSHDTQIEDSPSHVTKKCLRQSQSMLILNDLMRMLNDGLEERVKQLEDLLLKKNEDSQVVKKHTIFALFSIIIGDISSCSCVLYVCGGCLGKF